MHIPVVLPTSRSATDKDLSANPYAVESVCLPVLRLSPIQRSSNHHSSERPPVWSSIELHLVEIAIRIETERDVKLD